MINKEKKIYLIGNETKFVGYCMDKETAELFNHQRKNKYKIVKTKYTSELESRIYNAEIINPVLDTEYLLTEDEEMYLLDAFEQYLSDVDIYVKHMIKSIKYLKLTEEENLQAQQLVELLIHIRYELKQGLSHNLGYDDRYNDDADDFEMFDCEEVVKYFIEKII